MTPKRQQEIEISIEDSGYSINPVTGRIEAAVGSDADNNLDLN